MWAPGAGNPWPPPQSSQPPGPGIQTGGPPPSQNSNQWSLNPNHYANVPHNQVDWAALAQQWIILKGNGPETHQHHSHIQQQHNLQNINNMNMNIMMSMNVPPPHHIQQLHQQQQHQLQNDRDRSNLNHQQHQGHMNFQRMPISLISDHHPSLMAVQSGMTRMSDHMSTTGDIIGEAPMDVEPLEPHDNIHNNDWKTNPIQSNNWLSPEVNNPWSTTLNSPSTPQPLIPQKKHRHPPVVGYQSYSPYAASTTDPSVAALAAAVQDPASFQTGGGYWSHNDNSGDGVGLSQYSTGAHPSGYSSDENSMPDFDSAKRKTLPPWIREGLEKMEREKKRKEDQAKMELERDEMRRRRAEEQAALIAANPEAAADSKWSNPGADVDADQSDTDADDVVPTSTIKPKKQETIASILNMLPKDEQEEAIMYAIRRASTSVLVSVTNDMIYKAASDSFNRAKSRKKVTSTMHIKKTGALASITGPLGLGLGGYGSESEESDAPDVDSKSDKEKDSEPDSEDELIAEINRKKRNWELKKLELDVEGRSRSRSAGASDGSTPPTPERKYKEVDVGNHQNHIKSQGRNREVEKPNVLNENSGSLVGSIKATISSNNNGRRQSSDLQEKSSPIQDKELVKVKPVERDRKKRNSRSHSKSKSPSSVDRRKRSRSKDRKTKSRRDRSSSRHRTRKSVSRSPSSSRNRRRRSCSVDNHRRKRSKSRSAERHRRRRSKSSDSRKSKSRSKSPERHRRRDRSTSHSRKRRNRSTSNDKARNRKSRSKSRDRKRSRSKSRDRSRTKRKDSIDNSSKSSKSKEKSETDLKIESKSSSRKRSKSRSRSSSNISSPKVTKKTKTRDSKKKKRRRKRSSSSSSSSRSKRRS